MSSYNANRESRRFKFVFTSALVFIVNLLAISHAASVQTPAGTGIFYSRTDLKLNNNLLNGILSDRLNSSKMQNKFQNDHEII